MASPIERWDPFREMMSLRHRIDQIFADTLAWPRGDWLTRYDEKPVLDMYETDGLIKIDIPLPGVQPEEIELTMSGSTLTIKGERKTKEEVKEEHYYRHELHYGAFTRSVTLPEMVDTEHPEASFENGVLTVSFPKVAMAQPKRIEIKG